MLRKILFSLLFIGLICIAPHAQAAEFLNNASGPTGGTYYPVGAAMEKIWTDNIKGVKASAQSTGGTFNNISLLDKGEAEACFADGLYYDAYFGKDVTKTIPRNFCAAWSSPIPKSSSLLSPPKGASTALTISRASVFLSARWVAA